MKTKYLIYLFVPLLMACEETIVVDINNSEPAIVIEGQVTDQPGMQYVRISRSVDYYSTANPQPVTDAIVRVSDGDGHVFSFTHNPHGNSDSIGYYIPSVPFSGTRGQTYHLEVQAGNKIYEADDELRSIYPIQRMSYQVDEDEKEVPEIPGRIYRVLIDLIEPKETEDFYLLRFYRNGKLELEGNTDVYVYSDELIQEQPEGIAMPVLYKREDTARIEFYSLSPSVYTFYNDLAKVLNNDGGMFDPPPSNPRTNLTNGAFGYFQASAVAVKEIKID